MYTRIRGTAGRSLFVLMVPALLAGPTAAESVPAESVRQNLYATCFANERVGWAVGDLGRIFYTRDGAKTWEIQNAGTKRPFVAVACTDEKTAWLAGQSGQIARTRDGGASWTTLDSGTEMQLLGIAFRDASNGIVVGDYGTILRTTNGGDSWSTIAVPKDAQIPEEYFGIVEPGDIVLYDISWGSDTVVAVAGEFGVILRSNDAGASFQASPSPVETTLFGIFFADAQNGWAVGMESVLLATQDGGATWKRQKIKSPPGFSLSLYDLEVRGKLGWAVGSSGYLMTSTDAGRTWNLVQVVPQLGSYWFREVSLLTNGKGFVVGSTGIVLEIDGTDFSPHKERL